MAIITWRIEKLCMTGNCADNNGRRRYSVNEEYVNGINGNDKHDINGVMARQ